MSNNLAQLRRAVFKRWDKTANEGAGDWDTFVLDVDDLGQDTQLSFNFSPRKMSRASQLGTTETPIRGTFDTLTASITFIADTWEVVGKAYNAWNKATYTGAKAGDGNIIVGGAGQDICAGNEYVEVTLVGVCDDGSSTEVDFARCLPSLDDDIELGGSDAVEVTLALNPIAYNPAVHAKDGYPEYTLRLGAQDLTKKTHLNVTTGEYQEVTAAGA